MATKRVIIEAGDFGPEICLEGIGQICLSDFRLYDSPETKRRLGRLYRDGLGHAHRAMEMEESDIQRIIYFASNPQEDGVEDFRRELNGKYRDYGLKIPE